MTRRAWLVGVAMSLAVSVSTVSAVSAQVPPDSLRGRLLDLGEKSFVATGVRIPQLAGLVDTFAELLSLEVSTAPLGTSSGGFSYTFDRDLGVFTRNTQSFGPAFGKRSLTAGKGKFSVGFNWLHADYDSLGGHNIANGDLRPVKNVRTPDEDSGGGSSLVFDVVSDTIVGFASFGVTNDLDLGIAVPVVRIAVGADLTLLTGSGVDVTPGGHLLFVPTTSASGVGDIAVFGKYHVWRLKEGGVAAEIKLRLPTGDTNALRGIGVTRTLVSGIWSRGGRVAPHANAGYEFWSSGVPITPGGDVVAKNQVNYAFGVELQAHPLATVLVDVIGRRQLHGGKIGYQTVAIGPGSLDVLVGLPDGINVVSLAPGIKWNVAGSVLITGNVLTSLVNNGLKANVIPVVGLEWAF